MVRQFVLRNALGMERNLNCPENFFYNPAGLGQQHDTRYENIGDLYIKTRDDLSQKAITGKIRFAGYEDYHRFSLFVQHKPLTLVYTSYGTYSMDVSVDRLDKSELESLGLHAAIRMRGLSTWYRTVRGVNMSDGNGGKAYPYVYPYKYKDFASGEIILESDSALRSPCRIIIMGPCKNPAWAHYLNGKKIRTGKIGTDKNPCLIAAGNRLIIDNTTKNFFIREYDREGNELRDLYASSDFNTQRFLWLEYGSNKIRYQHENADMLNVIVEGRISYESV